MAVYFGSWMRKRIPIQRPSKHRRFLTSQNQSVLDLAAAKQRGEVGGLNSHSPFGMVILRREWICSSGSLAWLNINRLGRLLFAGCPSELFPHVVSKNVQPSTTLDWSFVVRLECLGCQYGNQTALGTGKGQMLLMVTCKHPRKIALGPTSLAWSYKNLSAWSDWYTMLVFSEMLVQ